jgi:lipopolysaccharide transport system ATP-binding protein
VLWLHHGGVRGFGEAGPVLEAYERAMHDATLERTGVGAAREGDGLRLGENRFGSLEATVESVTLDGRPAPATLRSGEPLRVAVEVAARDAAVEDPIVGVSIHRRSDKTMVLDVSTRAAGLSLGARVERAGVELTVDRLDLGAGEYAVNVGLYERGWEYAYDLHWDVYRLRVEGPSAGKGVVLPPHRWTRAP